MFDHAYWVVPERSISLSYQVLTETFLDWSIQVVPVDALPSMVPGPPCHLWRGFVPKRPLSLVTRLPPHLHLPELGASGHIDIDTSLGAYYEIQEGELLQWPVVGSEGC